MLHLRQKCNNYTAITLEHHHNCLCFSVVSITKMLPSSPSQTLVGNNLDVVIITMLCVFKWFWSEEIFHFLFIYVLEWLWWHCGVCLCAFSSQYFWHLIWMHKGSWTSAFHFLLRLKKLFFKKRSLKIQKQTTNKLKQHPLSSLTHFFLYQNHLNTFHVLIIIFRTHTNKFPRSPWR